MNQPWIPEHPFGIDKARIWIEKQLPHLINPEISLLGQGWDNVVYLINQDMVLRTPQRQAALFGFLTETKNLNLVQTHLITPKPKLYEPVPKIHPYPVSISEYLKGMDPVQARIDTLSSSSAQELGKFLACLHQMNPIENLPIDPGKRGDVHFRAQKLMDLSSDLRILPFLNVSHTSIPKRLVVCHGDLHFLHVLLDSQSEVTSIIDWGDMCLGNPLIDLAIVFLLFETDNQKILIQTYLDQGGKVYHSEILGAFILALNLNRALFVYAKDQNKLDLIDFCQRQWERMLQQASLESLKRLKT